MSRDDRDANVREFLERFVGGGLRRSTAPVTSTQLDEVVLTAGGTVVLRRWRRPTSNGRDAVAAGPAIVRSGCYLTHDSGLYERLAPAGFGPALEVWSQVLSIPDPDP